MESRRRDRVTKGWSIGRAARPADRYHRGSKPGVRPNCGDRSRAQFTPTACVAGMSSPPLSQPTLVQSGSAAGSLTSGLALASALIQNPQADSERASSRRPGRPEDARGGLRRGIGGGPVHHAPALQLERLAGPSAPRFATPHLASGVAPRTSLRAAEFVTRRLAEHGFLQSSGVAFPDRNWR